MKKNKKQKGTNLLLGASFCTVVVGVASLANTVMTFRTIMAQYTSQGYPAADVIRQLVPSQLLPGLFQGIGLYLAIAAVLYGLAIVNEKLQPIVAVDNATVAVEAPAEQVVTEAAPIVEETVEVVEAETVAEENTEKTGA